MSERKRSGAIVKWLVRIVLVLVVLAVVAAGVLATGIPQRYAVERGLSGALNASVSVDGLSLLGGLSMDGIVAQRSGESKPMLEVKGVEAEYTLFPEDKRYVPSLKVDSLALNLVEQPAKEPRPAEPPVPADPMKAPKKKTKRDNTPFIPKQMGVGALTLGYEASGMAFDVAGLSVQANYASGRDYSVTLEGPALTGSVHMGVEQAPRPLDGGSAHIGYASTGKTIALDPLQVHIPGLIELGGKGTLDRGKLQADFVLDQAVMEQVALPSLALPVSFAKLDASGTQIRGSVDKGAFKASFGDTIIHLNLVDLVLGAAGAEVYKGNLSIEGKSNSAEALDLELAATLGAGQQVTTRIYEKEMLTVGIDTTLADWSRDQVFSLIPPASRPGPGAMPFFQGVRNGQLALTIKALDLSAELGIEPMLKWSSADAPSVLLTASLKGSALGLKTMPLDTAVAVKVGEGSISCAGKGGLKTGVDWTAQVSQVDAAQWMEAFTGTPASAHMAALINGSVQVVSPRPAATLMQDLSVTLDLGAAPFRYGPVATAEGESLTLKGQAQVGNDPYWHASGPEMALTLGERARIQLTNWELQGEDLGLKAETAADVDLSLLSPDLMGRLTFQAPVTNEKGFTRAAVKATIEGLGFRPFGEATSVPIGLDGALVYDNLNGKLEGTALRTTFGEGTEIAFDSLRVTQSPFVLATPFDLKSNLDPLIWWGIVEKANATGRLNGQVGYDSQGMATKADLNITAAALMLTRGIAAFENLTLLASGGNSAGQDFGGAGTIACGKLMVAGATAHDLQGPIRIEGDNVKAAGIKGTLFQGAATADADIGVMQLGVPMTFGVHIDNADLEAFSTEMAVANLRLTGKATADIKVSADLEGLHGFDLTVDAPAALSVNVELIKQLLVSQYVQQLAGKKQMEKAMAKIIGKEDMRPFDSGRLTLHYEGERVTGTVALKSADLNLTVDLAIDFDAILEGIRMIQENQLSEFALQ